MEIQGTFPEAEADIALNFCKAGPWVLPVGRGPSEHVFAPPCNRILFFLGQGINFFYYIPSHMDSME
jgi:hypothetical protein